MTVTVWPALSSPPASGGEGFTPPSPDDFYVPLIGDWFTRPMLLALLSLVLLVGWLLWATKRVSVVPTKRQWFLENIYDFVRNGVARDMIGSHDFKRFTPLLFALFIFLLLNNWFGSMPFTNFPTMSRIGMVIPLVAIVYIGYHYAGIKKHGVGGYFKQLVPAGVPIFLAPIIFILEFASFFAIRPLTLTLRLFGNMFAGHMLMGVFILGGAYLLMSGSPGLMVAGAGSFVMGFLMQLLELLIQAIQAYVFVMLAASYFGGAVADEH
ncbi:F0F1 ATP synthase subunit A [Arsenicicoccus sp. oral taxon 190]|uniref:F0F1 ATP synthase subunit A n=1 Tax=Arsenicicoccus sp. oral taxon 190 TaxID=1658671 RepID=UPI000A9BB19C|nr:F0F1 ATP synthase subunit A [Arsenicicoccus sp. oral taxon 190]